MDFLRKATLSGLNGIQKAINEFKSAVETYDFNKIEREFDEMTRKWETLKNKFKEATDNFVVRVPYDADLHIIKSELNGNTFKVKVVNDETSVNNSCSFVYEVSVPNELINSTITQKYLKHKKEMLFVFKKSDAPTNVADVDDLINTINETVNETINVGNVDDLINEINETTNEVESVEEPTEFVVEVEENVHTNNSDVDEEEEFRKVQNEMIWRLYTEGKSYRKIAKQVGLSDKTVAKRIKKMIRSQC